MFDRQSLSSLLTLLAGVAAAVLLIALQPDPAGDPPAPRGCRPGAGASPPACTLADTRRTR